MPFGNAEVFLNHLLGGHPAQANNNLGPQQQKLLAQPGHAGFAFGRQRVTVLGRAALNNVRNENVALAAQIDRFKVAVQQLAAAADKGQALLVLVRAGPFADKQNFGIGHALAEDDVFAGFAQITAAAGKAFRAQGFKVPNTTRYLRVGRK